MRLGTFGLVERFSPRSQNDFGRITDLTDRTQFSLQPPQTQKPYGRIQRGDLLVSITGEPGKVTVADDTLGQAYVSQHVASSEAQ